MRVSSSLLLNYLDLVDLEPTKYVDGLRKDWLIPANTYTQTTQMVTSGVTVDDDVERFSGNLGKKGKRWYLWRRERDAM